MPGIFGAFKKERKEHMIKLMDRMSLSMNYGNSLRIDKLAWETGNLCMGRVSLGVLNVVDQPLKHHREDCWIVFHGELYDHGGKMSSDPEYVLEQYLQKGDQCASDLNGMFHFALYDMRSEQLKLFSDKFGLQPLYYSTLPGGLIFAAEIKAILTDDSIARTPDRETIADFLHYGQILGQKTLFTPIKALAPGSMLTFSVRNDEVSTKKYWHLDKLFVEKGNYLPTASADEAISLLENSIKARCANKEVLGLSLSGGLDSRGILAGLGRDAQGIKTYTLGLDGCADQRLAECMAKTGKTRHEFIELDQSYIQDFENMALNMIQLSDGMYHPHESTEMLALEYFKKARFKILLRGHGGETAKAALAYPVMVSPKAYSCTNGGDILDYIFNTANLVIRDIKPERLFMPSFCKVMKEVPRSSIKESCGKVSEILAPADACIYYYINEHIRRQVVASLEIFRTTVEIRMPYVDEAYLQALFTLPVKERNEGEIHVKLINKCMPELIKIPNSNTGAPLDAGPLRMFVTDKFNSLMKRFSVKGYRHYTEYQKWHREGFRENSQKIIFSSPAESRGLYNMDSLRSIFEAHVSGQKNYGHLLGTVVGLELWFRSFLD